mmetsp:Transcript_12703/g.27602  ORF Transcript_12703/g.27602 Transcript_12703/m.27602 type:complete len:165 (-) Transcript_12703:955-1449(-)
MEHDNIIVLPHTLIPLVSTTTSSRTPSPINNRPTRSNNRPSRLRISAQPIARVTVSTLVVCATCSTRTHPRGTLSRTRSAGSLSDTGTLAGGDHAGGSHYDRSVDGIVFHAVSIKGEHSIEAVVPIGTGGISEGEVAGSTAALPLDEPGAVSDAGTVQLASGGF